MAQTGDIALCYLDAFAINCKLNKTGENRNCALVRISHFEQISLRTTSIFTTNT